MSGPWVIAGQVLGLDKWSSAFSPSSMDGFVTPVWVRLPELPLYCWDLPNIARIVASLGEPLWVDAATNSMGRGAFARACVKLDLSKPLLVGVWIQSSYGKFYQRVEYEGLSKLCFRCGLVGHKEAACRYPPMSRAAQPDEASTGEVQGTAKDLSKEPMRECKSGDFTQQEPTVEGPGPWMVVQRRRSPTYKNQLKVPLNASQPKPKQTGDWMGKGTRVGGKNIKLHSLHATHQHALVVKDNSNSEPYSFPPSTRSLPSLFSKGNEIPNQPMDTKFLGNRLVNDKPFVNMSTSTEPSPTHELECSHAIVPYDNHVKESTNNSANANDSEMEKQVNEQQLLDVGKEATHVGDEQVNEQQHIELEMEGWQPTFTGFSALPLGEVGSAFVSVSAKARSRGGKIRGAKKEKMVCELGPVAPGSRKRRKAQSITDGGDASPSPPP